MTAMAQLLRAEWTKFRTVPAWLAGMAVAVLLTVGLGALAALATHGSGPGACGSDCPPPTPVGPDGEPVSDKFYFVHRSLAGDGDIVARVTALTGIITYPQSNPDAIVSGVEPWAKAGLIVKDGTGQGSPYAAVMVTGGHGVRMQYDFTHDAAGSPGVVDAAAPRWLRLTRSGNTINGYESSDGTRWSALGTATLAGLPDTVQVGLFVASPGDVQLGQRLGSGAAAHFTQASAVFDHVSLSGPGSGTGPGSRRWRGDVIGGGGHTDWERHHRAAGYTESGGGFTVTGSGDIAPERGAGNGIEHTLLGVFAGLIAVAVVAALFITTEYRRPLIRTTLSAGPRRGRVLAAKALVIGTVAFLAGLVAAGVAVPLCAWILHDNGADLNPVPVLTELRVVAGTAGLIAATALLALAVGTLVRRSAAAVTAVIVAVVLPYVLTVASAVPVGVSQWLMRATPAAGFAVQQTLHQYPQVDGPYTPSNGYFPLSPWAGFTVLCGYTVLALGLAAIRLRRSDA